VAAAAAVLLAAGGGTRFTGSTHKLLAPLGGRPLVAHAVASALAGGIGPVVVVSGAVDLSDVVPDDVVLIANPEWQQGQATSLAVAIGWARTAGLDAIVVGLGDQPSITPSAWRAVAAAAATPIAVATYQGRRGHPVRLAQAIWPRLPVTGDTGARGVMAESPDLVVEIACEGDPVDVDTVEDLARWR
jgi:molybdenum cofactor cytidylyltransferase